MHEGDAKQPGGNQVGKLEKVSRDFTTSTRVAVWIWSPTKITFMLEQNLKTL